MLNFRINLDKTFLNKEISIKASELIKSGKKIPKTFFNPKETSLYLTVSFQKQYFKVNTGLKIKPELFDTKNQIVLKRNETFTQMQLILNKIKSNCALAYRELYLKDEKIDKFKLKQIMERAVLFHTSEEKVLNFFELFEVFYKWKSKEVHENTIPRYRVLRDKLRSFETYSRKEIEISGIDKDFSIDFAHYLMDVHGLFNNTVAKYLKSLKCFLRFAFDHEYTSNRSFSRIESAENPTSIFVLEEPEIMRIYNLQSKNRVIMDVSQAFCFLCFTGQRYGDIKAMKWKDIVEINGRQFWRLYQSKVRATTFIDIPLLPEALELIKRHNLGRKKTELVFRVPCNSKMNQELKTIARLAKIEGEFTSKRLQGSKIVETTVKRHRKLSTHTGRKSFITNAIKRGMPITLVQKISNHTSIKAMKPYIELSNTFIADQMFEYFK